METTERWAPRWCPKCYEENLHIAEQQAACLDCHSGFTFAVAYDVPGMDPRPDVIYCRDRHGQRAYNSTEVRPNIRSGGPSYICRTCGNTSDHLHYPAFDEATKSQRKPYCYWCCEKYQADVRGPRRPQVTDAGRKAKAELESLEAKGQYSLFGEDDIHDQ